MTTPPETYLPDEIYFGLIDDILSADDTLDARSRVIELLGEIANVWPVKVLTDPVDDQTTV